MAAAATESRDRVVQALAEKKEKAELVKMGLEDDKEAEKAKSTGRKATEVPFEELLRLEIEAKRQHSLLQLSSEIVVDNGSDINVKN